jgi:hypothetical protein
VTITGDHLKLVAEGVFADSHLVSAIAVFKFFINLAQFVRIENRLCKCQSGDRSIPGFQRGTNVHANNSHANPDYHLKLF